jgi:hypothetical protein
MVAILCVIGFVVWSNAATEREQTPSALSTSETPKNSVAQKDYSDPTVIAEELAKIEFLKPIVVQARVCIRSGIPEAYKSGAYGSEQVLAFFSRRCFAPYNIAFQKSGQGNISEEGFKLLVAQELAH